MTNKLPNLQVEPRRHRTTAHNLRLQDWSNSPLAGSPSADWPPAKRTPGVISAAARVIKGGGSQLVSEAFLTCISTLIVLKTVQSMLQLSDLIQTDCC